MYVMIAAAATLSCVSLIMSFTLTKNMFTNLRRKPDFFNFNKNVQKHKVHRQFTHHVFYQQWLILNLHYR